MLLFVFFLHYAIFDLKSGIAVFFFFIVQNPTFKKVCQKYDLFDEFFENTYANQLFCLENSYFQILWKSRCHILVTFPSHLKKLRSILIFVLEKLNCGCFHSFHS